MSLSIYSCFYNVEAMGFDWRGALQNWYTFLQPAGQIVIAVNTSTDNTAQLVRDYAKQIADPRSQVQIDVIDISIPYDDPEFDGKGKAAALKHCTQSFAILLDCDERVVPSQRPLWMQLAHDLERNYSFDAFLVPVVDLIEDEYHYKSLGSKWYLHRNTPKITRGVHKQGYREDGSIDKTKSDTCEAIYVDSRELVRAQPLLLPGLPNFITISQLEGRDVPFVFHLGWLQAEQRLKQAEFWRPHWDTRDGGHSKEPALTLEDFNKLPHIRHNLSPWKTS